MLPVNIAKGKCLTRSLGDLLVMAPQQSPLTTLRYSPYPLPVTAAAAAATPQQLTQLATAGSFNNVMSPAVSLSVPMMPTLPLEMQPGMLSLIPQAHKAQRTSSPAALAPQQHNISNLGYNVNDLINIQNLQRPDTVPTFSFPLGF